MKNKLEEIAKKEIEKLAKKICFECNKPYKNGSDKYEGCCSKECGEWYYSNSTGEP
jgi:hypothetical protein